MYIENLRIVKNCAYEIIACDPPWSYTNKGVGGNGTSGAEKKYPVMSVGQLCALPVGDITHTDATLFMWVTLPTIEQSFQVMRAWGFRYKTNGFTWIKTNKKATNTLFTGLGFWTRSNAELCLIGVKGKPKRVRKDVHSVIMSPVRAHSQKPDEYRDRIVTLMGDKPRIELFARGDKDDGWDRFGNMPNFDPTPNRRARSGGTTTQRSPSGLALHPQGHSNTACWPHEAALHA